MIKLHGIDVSGNTYKVSLLLSILKIEYEFSKIDVVKQHHKSVDFLKLNPRGEFPVLQDGEITIWDSQAILIYLSRQYGGHHLYPDRPAEMSHITQWLCVANNEIHHSLAKARAILKFSRPGNLKQCQLYASTVLNIINNHLSGREWIATEHFSLADIACYPYIALAEEGEISLRGYRHISHWIERMQNIDNYIEMPGLPFVSA